MTNKRKNTDSVKQDQEKNEKVIKEYQKTIENLKFEIKNNLDLIYLKNIIFKFFQSDLSVLLTNSAKFISPFVKIQEQTIPAIAHVLKCSVEETENLKKQWRSQMAKKLY